MISTICLRRSLVLPKSPLIRSFNPPQKRPFVHRRLWWGRSYVIDRGCAIDHFLSAPLLHWKCFFSSLLYTLVFVILVSYELNTRAATFGWFWHISWIMISKHANINTFWSSKNVKVPAPIPCPPLSRAIATLLNLNERWSLLLFQPPGLELMFCNQQWNRPCEFPLYSGCILLPDQNGSGVIMSSGCK